MPRPGSSPGAAERDGGRQGPPISPLSDPREASAEVAPSSSISTDGGATDTLGAMGEDEGDSASSTTRPPPTNVSVLSSLTLGWVSTIISDGLKRPLTQDDVWPASPSISPRLLGERASKLFDVVGDGRARRSLLSIVFEMTRREVYLSLANALGSAVCSIARPVLLGEIVNHIEGTGRGGRAGAWGCVVGLAGATVLQGFFITHFFQLARCGVGVPTLCITNGLIFERALKVGRGRAGDDAEGRGKGGSKVKSGGKGAGRQAGSVVQENVDKKDGDEGSGVEGGQGRGDQAAEVTLVSSDAQNLFEAIYWVLRGTEFLVTILASAALLLSELGGAALAGMATLAVAMVLQSKIGNWQHAASNRQQVHADKRLHLLSQALSCISLIKYSGLEDVYGGEVLAMRKSEMKDYLKFRIYWACNEFITGGTSVLVAVATLVTYVAIGNTLNARVVFVSLALFNLMRQPLTFIPLIVSSAIKGWVAAGRIDSYLGGGGEVVGVGGGGEEAGARVVFEDASFAWGEGKASGGREGRSGHGGRVVLDGVSVEAEAGTLTSVVGPVAAGKTTLLLGVLGEKETCKGKVEIRGGAGGVKRGVAYVPQRAWIKTGTVRENILCGSTMERGKYNEVVKACALEADFEGWEGRDMVWVGEDGVTLSGGQRQRVALARAVYNAGRVVLLDDPFSALDVKVKRWVFEKLLEKNCGLLRRGKEGAERVIIMVTHDPSLIEQSEHVWEVQGGKVCSRNGRGGQEAGNEMGIGAPGGRDNELKIDEEMQRAADGGGSDARAAVDMELNNQGNIQSSVVSQFVNLSGGKLFIAAISFFNLLVEGTLGLSDWWLTQWIADEDEAREDGREAKGHQFWALTYSAWALANCLFFLSRAFVFLRATINVAEALHERLLLSVMRAPLGWFQERPSGVVLNRFAGDMFEVEVRLSHYIEHLNQCVARVLMLLIAVCLVVPVILPAVPPIAWLFWRELRMYRAAFRETKRLSSGALSPVISSFSETLGGRVTVRAFGLQNWMRMEFHSRMEIFARNMFALYAVQNWEFLRISMLGSFLTAATAVVVVACGSEDDGGRLGLTGGEAGLALNFVLLLNFYLMGWVVLFGLSESSLTSVERILAFCDVEPEGKGKGGVHEGSGRGGGEKGELLPKSWPDKGHIVIKDLVVGYAPNSPDVLKGVSFEVKAGWKVGVVGRTGAGKSTLASALFRIVEPRGGTITVDGRDLQSVELKTMRGRFGVVLQEPLLMAGTVRSNLDPRGEWDEEDEELWKALEAAGAATEVRAGLGGLEGKVEEGGSNLSQGTRQLICLARALLAKPKVLVCDEATASLDGASDEVVARAVGGGVASGGAHQDGGALEGSVLIIAHRLETVERCDWVVVLDKGVVVEQGRPSELRKQKGSWYGGMWGEN